MKKYGIFAAVCILAFHLFFCMGCVLAQDGQINSDETLIAINYGYDIHVTWIDLPEGTTKIVLSRGPSKDGPWEEVLINEYPNDLL